MKNVRIFYEKIGRMKFISHLDMIRFMARLVKKSGIPVWYTEGFNQHIYLNFALPLSLGFESLYEVLELRLTSDSFSCEECLEALKNVAPPDIRFIEVKEPVMDMKDISFAEYSLEFENTELNAKLEEFLQRDSIICEKKGKKGKIKEVDLIPKIKNFSFEDNKLTLRVAAGNNDTLNPSLVMDTFFKETQILPVYYKVTRTKILNNSQELFC